MQGKTTTIGERTNDGAQEGTDEVTHDADNDSAPCSLAENALGLCACAQKVCGLPRAHVYILSIRSASMLRGLTKPKLRCVRVHAK